MAIQTTNHRRIATGVLAAGLLLAPLTGCGDTAEDTAAPEATATESTPGEETATESAPAEETGDPTATSEPEDTAATTGMNGDTNASADCTGTSCSVTLSGGGAQTEVLGTPIALGTVENGRATVRVGGQEVACSQGESVSAGPLTLECTTVTQDSVTMTAALG